MEKSYLTKRDSKLQASSQEGCMRIALFGFNSYKGAQRKQLVIDTMMLGNILLAVSPLETLDWLMILAYFAIVLALAIWVIRKSKNTPRQTPPIQYHFLLANISKTTTTGEHGI